MQKIKPDQIWEEGGSEVRVTNAFGAAVAVPTPMRKSPWMISASALRSSPTNDQIADRYAVSGYRTNAFEVCVTRRGLPTQAGDQRDADLLTAVIRQRCCRRRRPPVARLACRSERPPDALALRLYR
jgi:hypothetical protein